MGAALTLRCMSGNGYGEADVGVVRSGKDYNAVGAVDAGGGKDCGILSVTMNENGRATSQCFSAAGSVSQHIDACDPTTAVARVREGFVDKLTPVVPETDHDEVPG